MSGFYSAGMQAFARGEVVWKASGGSNIRVALIDTADYTVDLINHNFVDDITAGIEERSGNLTLADAESDGVVSASNVTIAGTTGDTCEAVLLYKFVTVDADSVPLFYWDSGSGLPVTLGYDVQIVWQATVPKIARI